MQSVDLLNWQITLGW